MDSIWHSVWKLPEMSHLANNSKWIKKLEKSEINMAKIKWDFLSDFQTLWSSIWGKTGSTGVEIDRIIACN